MLWHTILQLLMSNRMEPDNDYPSRKIHLEPVKFDDGITYARRPRTGIIEPIPWHDLEWILAMYAIDLGTNESGIDVNQYHTKSGARRQQQPSAGNWIIYILFKHLYIWYYIDLSEVDSDTMSSPGILSDEVTEDEGIGRNVKKYRGAIIDNE